MKRLAAALVIGMSGLAFLQAQHATMIRVDYEAVTISPDGAETLESKGVHYFTADGRYRRDETFAAGEHTSLYRLPADGVNVSVSHDLQVAVPGRKASPEPRRFAVRSPTTSTRGACANGKTRVRPLAGPPDRRPRVRAAAAASEWS